MSDYLWDKHYKENIELEINKIKIMIKDNQLYEAKIWLEKNIMPYDDSITGSVMEWVIDNGPETLITFIKNHENYEWFD